MFRRLRERLHAFPLARLGGALVVLGSLVEALDALGQIDISPIVTAFGFNPALVIAGIGATKIALRFVLAVAAALSAAKVADK